MSIESLTPDQLKMLTDEMEELQFSSLAFARIVFGLTPQPIKEEYRARFAIGLLLRDEAWSEFCKTVRPHWFEPYQEGYHLTWQQSLVFHGVDKAMRHEAPARISIVSGHGIGKSTTLAILILWYLLAFPDCQVPCTAPTQSTLYDILWKEIKKWLDKMPNHYKNCYVWEATHIRMKRNPETWFARAKTASKENPEALAGVHADQVLIAVDEASGVEEPIFETMEGALTSGNILVFLISNGTRSIGYFYDTHHKDKARWQNYTFNSLESPRVDEKYVKGIEAKYGNDSVQYAIRVLGQFPSEGIMDDGGYVQLFNERDLHLVPFDTQWKPVGRIQGALDASGEGQDKTAWAIRDRMRGAIVALEDTSTSSGMAIKSITICDKYDIDPIDFTIDAFGKGADVGMEIALATSKQKRPWRVSPLNIGEPCPDELDRTLYVNIRAMIYYKMMLWVRAGGEFMESPRLHDQLLSIRFKRTSNGRIQIMDKVTSKKLGFPSPDMADALSMTFLRPDSLAKRSLWGDEQKARADAEFDANTTME